jgi:hypothetical protein
MVTLIISTGWMIQVANIPLTPPITKGCIESKNLSVVDLGVVIFFILKGYFFEN